MNISNADKLKYLKKPLSTEGGSVVTFVWIPPGVFAMGEDSSMTQRTYRGRRLVDCSDNEGPQHFIVIVSGFWMAEAPITKNQWASAMGSTGGAIKTEELDLPVAGVSWVECKEFCRRASLAAECVVDLPTEAEWEYACRAGTSGDTYFGNLYSDWVAAQRETLQSDVLLNHAILQRMAWFDCDGVRPVRQKVPNAFGLYDMLGNVWEWCRDVYYPSLRYDGFPLENGPGDITESSQLKKRSIRGGGFQTNAEGIRCSVRGFWTENHGREEIGFRPIIRKKVEHRRKGMRSFYVY